jgi:hypothetical protein
LRENLSIPDQIGPPQPLEGTMKPKTMVLLALVITIIGAVLMNLNNINELF